MATTLDDLAREAGVCKMTASLALRGKGRLSGTTRERIRRLAEERGYRPNASARAVSNGYQGCVALVQSTHVSRSYLPRDLLLGVEHAVADRGAHLLLAHLEDAQMERPETMPRVLREWACDGLLLNYHYGIPELLLSHLERYAIPVVWLNADLPQDGVRHDDRLAGRVATQHLLDLGHRRIAYADLNYEVALLDGPQHYSRTDRRDGYREAMASAGLPAREWRDGWPVRGAETVQVLLRELSAPGRPTAVVLHSLSSQPLLQDAVWRAGLRVPDDLSVVVTCNEGEIPVWGCLHGSTVELRQTTLGETAVRLLWQRLAQPSTHLPVVTVAPQVVPRQTSMRPLPRATRRGSLSKAVQSQQEVPMHSTSPRRLIATLCTVLATVSSVPALHTWTGADTSNSNAWGSASNWSPTSVPGSGDDVQFTATGTNVVDLGGAERLVNTVVFSHASGTTFVLTNGILRCTSTASTAVAVTGNGTVQTPATLGMSGDAFGIRKAGTGTWTLQAANAFSGGVTIADGTLTVAKSGGQGSGTITYGVANKTLRWTTEPHVVTNAITFASSFYGSMYFEADTTLTGPIALPNAASSVKFYPTAIGRILGSVSAPATGGCILEVRNGTKELVVYDPSSVTEPSGVNARIQVTSGGAMLAVRDVGKLFSGHLLINNGVLLLDGVSWNQFLANRSGGYGADTGAGCRKWQFGDGSGFAARTSDLVIGNPGEDLSYLFDRNFRLSSSLVETNGLRYADADVVIRGDVALSGANRTITVGASGPGVDPIAPQHSFAVIAGTLSGSGVAPVFVSTRTGTQYQNNQVGEVVLRGTSTWTGGLTGNFWSSYWFSSGAGGLLNANTNTVNYHSLVRFDGNASLPRGNAGQPAHLAAFLNVSGGASLCHGFLLTAKPGGETYELPTGYRFVLGGMGNRSAQNVLGASSHDGVDGTATLQNSDICHHGLPASVLGGDAGFSELGLLVRDGTWILGTDAGGPARFIPVWSLDTAPSAAATALNDDLRVRTLLKRGQGTLALANVTYTTLNHAGSTRTNFVWTIGRGAASGVPANAGAGAFFDGAVRGRSTVADDSTATLANSLFAAASSFNLRLAGGVYEVDANGASPRLFTAAVGGSGGQVTWVGGSGSTGVASGGGFSAYGGPLTVNLSGTPEWSATSFIGDNAPLMFGSFSATHDVTWADPLGLDNADNATVTRDIRVIARTADFAGGIRNRSSGTAGGTGARSLTKTGAGTLTLSASVNDYNGTTTVAEGTLHVTGTLSAGGGDVTVQSGARLSGTGTVARNVLLQDGGAVAPGASAGTLTLTNVTVAAGGAYEWEFLSDVSDQSDKAAVTGDLTFAGPWTVRLAQLGVAVPGQNRYVLFEVTGAIAGFDPEQVTVEPGDTAWPDAYEVVRIGSQIVLKRATDPATLILVR